MHIIKDILICQNLQTDGKVLIRFPETQGQGKKRKQCKFITYISFFIFLPPSFSQARADVIYFSVKILLPIHPRDDSSPWNNKAHHIWS